MKTLVKISAFVALFILILIYRRWYESAGLILGGSAYICFLLNEKHSKQPISDSEEVIFAVLLVLTLIGSSIGSVAIFSFYGHAWILLWFIPGFVVHPLWIGINKLIKHYSQYLYTLYIK